jgi:hypothetical protein
VVNDQVVTATDRAYPAIITMPPMGVTGPKNLKLALSIITVTSVECNSSHRSRFRTRAKMLPENTWIVQWSSCMQHICNRYVPMSPLQSQALRIYESQTGDARIQALKRVH